MPRRQATPILAKCERYVVVFFLSLSSLTNTTTIPTPCPTSGNCWSICQSACVILYLTLSSDIYGESADTVQPLTSSVLLFKTAVSSQSQKRYCSAPMSLNHHFSPLRMVQICLTGSRKICRQFLGLVLICLEYSMAGLY